jgi:hypothetical protein
MYFRLPYLPAIDCYNGYGTRGDVDLTEDGRHDPIYLRTKESMETDRDDSPRYGECRTAGNVI